MIGLTTEQIDYIEEQLTKAVEEERLPEEMSGAFLMGAVYALQGTVEPTQRDERVIAPPYWVILIMSRFDSVYNEIKNRTNKTDAA